MSDFKQYDGETETRDIVLDDEFDPDTFIFNMNELDATRRPTTVSGRRSALELLERRNEERWLREQLGDLDDDHPH